MIIKKSWIHSVVAKQRRAEGEKGEEENDFQGSRCSRKLRKQILWKRGQIKGRVIRRTSEDKVGNAFGFHANIILIPVLVKEAVGGLRGREQRQGLGRVAGRQGAKRGWDRERMKRRRRRSRGGSGLSWTEASNQGDIIFPLRPAVF